MRVREMIGKGLFKVDDYARFGRFVEELSKAGAYLISYVPKTNQILVFAKRSDVEHIKTILDGKEYKEISLRGTLVMFRVKW
ncbi:MAG: hypothetical protein H0Z19_11245 [Archaeoglobus sp.]|uniref:hypothetical protein n=1 Tax=Archaeoglobus sp. TaxID=1872626 RepID=UPI001DCB27F5|nr:hypothetical protein [Archaeoglobus sp.]MBO8181022.1 hypothetical protein [Archaeoglobus sp.]